MGEKQLMEILYRIRACIQNDDFCTAIEYANFEIEKLLMNSENSEMLLNKDI